MSMTAMVPTATLEASYQQAFPKSKTLYERALTKFPNGVTHDGRFMKPFPVYIDRASGSHKWTVDGHDIIDYWMGHGSLLLGHSHPVIVDAITEQAGRGTHYGACHELEIEWADWVMRLVPSAETVRFVSSGTEATLMAIRLARTFTGKRKVVKFYGHYHGWHDQVMDGVGPNHDQPMPGVLPEVFDALISLPVADLNLVEHTLKQDEDIACLILEPTGALFGGTEHEEDFVVGLRRLTEQYGVVFIMDEVVTGFRCAPGGAQEYYGIKPDLCTLAKILAAGLNGGAVVGRSDIMGLLEIRTDTQWQTTKKMLHYGTFNANPLSAAAGIAMLKRIADGRDIAIANDRAALLRGKFAKVLEAQQMEGWRVYGSFSGIKVSPAQKPGMARRGNLDLLHAIRQGMLLNGVDFMGVDGLTSAVHTMEDLEHTTAAFTATLTLLRQDGIIA
jgi:glutamate-1-semialdehyde 2,1-aminomutase